jgi:hypothetical protein
VLLGKRAPDGHVASPLDLAVIRRPRTPPAQVLEA